jgi:hypothetical protein
MPIHNSKAIRSAATTSASRAYLSNETMNHAVYPTSGALSVSFWIKLDNTDVSQKVIVRAEDASAVSLSIHISSGKLFFQPYDTSGNVKSELFLGYRCQQLFGLEPCGNQVGWRFFNSSIFTFERR